MPAPSIDLDAYFARIGYTGMREPSLDVLHQLHLLHTEAIAFENLSPLLGLGVALDAVALQDKLVKGKRGGYCFEQNLLFLHVLEDLGFDARGLAARVRWNLPAGMVLPRTHMLLSVTIAGSVYIVDVGFGGMTLTTPLGLRPGSAQATPHGTFRLVHAAGLYGLEARIADGWQMLYEFDLQAQERADYDMSNWYVSTHPRSRFVNELMVARAAPGCRHALIDNDYSIYRIGDEPERRVLRDVDDLMNALVTAFGIEVTALPGIEEKLRSIIRRRTGA